MDSAGKLEGSFFLLLCVKAVVVDHNLIVDVELRSVIGQQPEGVPAWIADPESSDIVDREPLVALRDAGKARLKSCGGMLSEEV